MDWGLVERRGGAGHWYANNYVYENPMFQDQIQVLECFKWMQKIKKYKIKLKKFEMESVLIESKYVNR